MKRVTFKFNPALWLNNKSLRACSPAARGFWADLLCLCFPSGHLTVNGRPVSDDQLARMIGEPVKSVREWLKELGEAGIYSVSDDGSLYSSRMVKETAFSEQAKASGARGGKVATQTKRRKAASAPFPKIGLSEATVPVPVEVVIKRKSLPWWSSPAGWVRYGATQAMSMIPGEDIDQFQVRLSAKIPGGPHLAALTESQRMQVESIRPKEPGK